MMAVRLGLFAGAASLLVAGCAAEEGGGPLGFVAFDKNHHVSSAEPLFGKEEDRCLDSPAFLLAIYAKDQPSASSAVDAMPQSRRAACHQVMGAIQEAMAFGSFATPYDGVGSAGREPYSDRQRNEVIDALMAASNRKCSRYIAFLQQYDANINSTLGIAAQATAIIASVASGGTAQGFAAASGIAGGARGTLNNAHFQNQTIAVLTNAFENSRATQRLEISRRQQCTPARYTMMRGLEDAFRYHGSCSIVFGLKQAQRAVDEAAAPNLDSFTRMLDQLADAQTKMATLTGKGQGASGQPQTPPAQGEASTSERETPPPPAPAPKPAPSAANGSTGTTDSPVGNGDRAAAATCPFDPPSEAKPQASGAAKPRVATKKAVAKRQGKTGGPERRG